MATEGGDVQVSRRAVLRLFGSAAGMALLAACQPSAQPSPPTAAPVPKPTTPAAAPQPAAGPTAAPAGAAASDRPTQAGFVAVGVGPSAAEPLSPPKGQPRPGGTLRIGNLGDLPNADGHWINGQNVIYPVFDRLVDLDASLGRTPRWRRVGIPTPISPRSRSSCAKASTALGP